MTNREPPASTLTQAQRTALRAHARAQCEAAAALSAEHRQTRRQTLALVEARNAILESAVAIAGQILERREISLAEPVAARLWTDDRGSTGVEVTVTLEDPTNAAAAKQALAERFGGEARCDRLIVR